MEGSGQKLDTLALFDLFCEVASEGGRLNPLQLNQLSWIRELIRNPGGWPVTTSVPSAVVSSPHPTYKLTTSSPSTLPTVMYKGEQVPMEYLQAYLEMSSTGMSTLTPSFVK